MEQHQISMAAEAAEKTASNEAIARKDPLKSSDAQDSSRHGGFRALSRMSQLSVLKHGSERAGQSSSSSRNVAAAMVQRRAATLSRRVATMTARPFSRQYLHLRRRPVCGVALRCGRGRCATATRLRKQR